jgi:hypothetical protein
MEKDIVASALKQNGLDNSYLASLAIISTYLDIYKNFDSILNSTTRNIDKIFADSFQIYKERVGELT